MNLEDFITIVPCDTLPPGVVAVLGHITGPESIESYPGPDDSIRLVITRQMRIDGVIIDSGKELSR